MGGPAVNRRWLLLGALVVALLACVLWRGREERKGLDGDYAPGRVVRLAGSPEEIGRRHGAVLAEGIKVMLREYAEGNVRSERIREIVLERVRTMKPCLPDWYLQELSACAAAAGVDEDLLLFAQCEGDIMSVSGCTTFVAFGETTHDGQMEIGRNFDYWGLESTDRCAVVLAVTPRPEDGYAFVSVGWSGILGGWTFFNEKGLFVANNLGGFSKTNPEGVPTLILERIIAQKAGTVAEAIEVVQKTPRMRGQAFVIGQAGNAGAGIAPDAVTIHFDAERVEVTRGEGGWAFDSSVGTSPDELKATLRDSRRRPTAAIWSAGNTITLHSVAIRPAEWQMWVAHGLASSAHRGGYEQYDLRALFGTPFQSERQEDQ